MRTGSYQNLHVYFSTFFHQKQTFSSIPFFSFFNRKWKTKKLPRTNIYKWQQKTNETQRETLYRLVKKGLDLPLGSSVCHWITAVNWLLKLTLFIYLHTLSAVTTAADKNAKQNLFFLNVYWGDVRLCALYTCQRFSLEDSGWAVGRSGKSVVLCSVVYINWKRRVRGVTSHLDVTESSDWTSKLWN